jgi:hypothetical protein
MTPDRFRAPCVAVAERSTAESSKRFRELGVKTKSDDPAGDLPLMRLFFEIRTAGAAPIDREGSAPAESSGRSGDLVLLGRVVGLLRGLRLTRHTAQSDGDAPALLRGALA